MSADPRQILFQLKAQCLQLTALERSFQFNPENQSGEVVDFVNFEKQMLEAISESLIQWGACSQDMHGELAIDVAEIKQLIAIALDLHNRNQADLEIWGDQVKNSLDETRKTLQLVHLYPRSQGANRLDVVG